MTNSTPQSNVEHFGKFLATLRVKRELTQERLAHLSGVSGSTIRRAEDLVVSDIRLLTATHLLDGLESVQKLTAQEREAFKIATGISRLAAAVPETRSTVGGADMIRGAIDQFKGMIASRRAAGISADYEHGAVSGLVMALEFIGEVTRDEAKALREDTSLVLAGGVA